MKHKLSALAAALITATLALPMSSTAATLTLGEAAARVQSSAKNLQTYATSQQLQTFVAPDDRYTGVGGLFIEFASTATTGFGSICTGSLIGPSLVLTAAHCLDTTASDPVTAITFFLPSYARADGSLAGRRIIDGAGFLIHPNYQGTTLRGNDAAVVGLFEAAGPGREIYELYSGNAELDNTSYQKVGTGTIGLTGTGTFDPSLGEPSDFDFRKRVGLNQYEFLWGDVLNTLVGAGACVAGTNDAFGAPCDGMLAYDVDSGSAANDVFGSFMGKPDLGRTLQGVLVDSGASPGDSGGPTFIDGRIAGITSFGITGNIFEPGNCGAGSVDPSAAADGFCTDSSIGEISVDTRVASRSVFSFLNAFVEDERQFWGPFDTTLPMQFLPDRNLPVPGSLLLAALAVALVPVARRRR